MRKHRTRWVAILGVAALTAAGPVGLAGSALADEEGARALSWPVVRQGQSSYSLDGYEIGYLPSGLERYGLNASSTTTDRQGGRQSQLSWVQGPDQLYGRVSVIRSEAIQDLDDLRTSRYSHIPDRELELLEGDAAFTEGAYLSEETGDLFWLERPGVAVAAHLRGLTDREVTVGDPLAGLPGDLGRELSHRERLVPAQFVDGFEVARADAVRDGADMRIDGDSAVEDRLAFRRVADLADQFDIDGDWIGGVGFPCADRRADLVDEADRADIAEIDGD
jgi:hypothetical protein